VSIHDNKNNQNRRHHLEISNDIDNRNITLIHLRQRGKQGLMRVKNHKQERKSTDIQAVYYNV